jgi:hypothetical protein
MGSILELRTNLRSLRSVTYTGRDPYVSTTLSADINSTPPKTPNTVQLAAERRKDDASRLIQLLKDRPGLTFLAKQSLLSLSESGKVSKVLKNLASTAAIIPTQALLSGTGYHGSVDIITGNTYLPVKTTANSKTIIPDNKLNKEEILKGIPSGEVTNKGQGQPLGEPYGVGYKYGGPPTIDREKLESNYIQSSVTGSTSLTSPKTFSVDGKYGRTRDNLNKLEVDAKKYLEGSKEIKFSMGLQGKRGTADTLQGIDKLNYLNVVSSPVADRKDIIPFRITIFEPGKNPSYVYLRAYLETFDDRYSGDWNSSNYIGRAESVFNYTGFKRDISFSLKIAASSEYELLPLYQKLNKIVGTTAPSYSSTFMRGVFVKLTVGDYLKDTPGFFNSVSLTWDKSYPWEIKTKEALTTTPSVPHILDISISFTPIHDFTPEINKPFITDENILKTPPQFAPAELFYPDITRSGISPEEIELADPAADIANSLQEFDAEFENYLQDLDNTDQDLRRKLLQRRRDEVARQGGPFIRQSSVLLPTPATALTFDQGSFQDSPIEAKEKIDRLDRLLNSLEQNSQFPIVR